MELKTELVTCHYLLNVTDSVNAEFYNSSDAERKLVWLVSLICDAEDIKDEKFWGQIWMLSKP